MTGTTITTESLESLATTLAQLFEDVDREAQKGPKRKRTAVANALLDGACLAAYSLGVGFTPGAVRMLTTDAVRKHPYPATPAGGAAFPTERREWMRTVGTYLAVRLHEDSVELTVTPDPIG